jgi:general secretion pathway protein K
MANSDHPKHERERGFALVIVLFSLVLITLLSTQLIESGEAEIHMVDSLHQSAQLQEASDGALYETIWHMLNGDGDYWPPSSGIRILEQPNVRIVVRICDERGKMDINEVPATYLSALYSVLGTDESTASAVGNAIADWRSQPGQADTPLIERYKGAGRIWGPSGKEFQHLDELLLVMGMTRDLLDKAAPYLTVGLEQSPWVSHAGPQVMAAIAKASQDNGVPITDADSTGPVVVRFTVQAIGQDGFTFTRNSLIRFEGGRNGPAWSYRILAWDHGGST